jgi:hypothetical protein
MSSRALTKPRRVKPAAPKVPAAARLARTPPRVETSPGIEFLGKARAARAKIQAWAERDDPQITQIIAAARSVYTRRSTKVPVSLIESTAARWKAISLDGSLSQSSVRTNERTLEITDVRLLSGLGHHHDPRWQTEENEPSILATRHWLKLTKDSLYGGQRVLLFGISISAIAFWYQYGFQISWDDLMTDLAMLAKVVPNDVPGEFSIPCANATFGGFLCEPPLLGSFLAIRTFVSDDMA